jgi:hypothetical protein
MILYWREPKSNKIYRAFIKLIYSKELQFKHGSKKGFLYQQSFLMRLVYISLLFLIGIILLRFVVPIDLYTIQLFLASISGTLIGTYVANFVYKSSEFLDEKGDSFIDSVKDTVEKGKDYIRDIEGTENKNFEEIIEEPKAPKKSARQRLKEKGHI